MTHSPPSDSVGLSQHFTLYGEDLDIYVMEPSGNVLALIRQTFHILILLLILNILPELLMNLLENSITSRLSRLEKVFQPDRQRRVESRFPGQAVKMRSAV